MPQRANVLTLTTRTILLLGAFGVALFSGRGTGCRKAGLIEDRADEG